MKRFLLILTILLTLQSAAQRRKALAGKVTVSEIPAEADEVKITNIQSGEKLATTPGGFFTMNVRKGDTLMFRGIEIVTRRMVITGFDMDEELLLVDLDRPGTQLSAVNVDGRKITTSSLGIPQGKAYTVAERRAHTGSTTKSQRPVDQAYTAVGTDGALNKLSGRDQQLKKELEVEKKQMWKQRLSERYERQYFTDTLKIPAAHVEGFLFYSVDDKKFLTALESDNKEQVELQLGVLATGYRKTLKNEDN